MKTNECKFCGFTGNAENEPCSICGNKTENENHSQPFAAEINPPVQTTFSSGANANYKNPAQSRFNRASKCVVCGTEIPSLRRICAACEQSEKKSGFNFLRLGIILLPLSVILLFTFWLFYFYLGDPVKTTVRNYETLTGLTKDLNYNNYRITGSSVVKIKETTPNERGVLGSRENELEFEMIFTKSDQFYIHFYRDPKTSYTTDTQKSVYVAGSNGYRPWQSVLEWNNLGITDLYRLRFKDTEGFPAILLTNLLVGLTDIKSFDKTDDSGCRSVSNGAARLVMSPKVYTIDGREFNAYPCENVYLSVQDSKGFSSVLGFDPQTGVLLSKKGNAIIEDKNAIVELQYGKFNRTKIGVKSGNSTVQKEILIPSYIFIDIIIGNVQAATIKLTIKNIETDASFDPAVFEKPLL